MRKLLSVGILLLVLLAIATTAAAQDNPRLRVIADGETANGVLRDDITGMIFAFNAAEGNTVSVSLALGEGSNFTPAMALLGPAGQVIASGETALQAEIPFSGSYFVLVSTFESIDGAQPQTFAEPQPFALTISGNRPPAAAGNNLAYFRSDLTYGTDFEGYSSPSEPVYYFVFNGAANDVLNVVMSSGDLDTLVMVFDDQGRRIAVNDDAKTTNLLADTDSTVEGLTLPADGLYFVFATDVAFYRLPNLEEDAPELNDFGGEFVINVSPQ
jgi:hypothetical protein